MNINQLIKELKKQRAIAVERGINPKRVTVNIYAQAQDDPTGEIWEAVEWAELRPCVDCDDADWLLCLNVPPIKPVGENTRSLKLIGGQPK